MDQTITLCKQYNIFTDVLINLEREVSDAMLDILSREEEDKDLGYYAEGIGEERTFRKMIRDMYNMFGISEEELANKYKCTVNDIKFILENDDSDLEKEAWWRD